MLFDEPRVYCMPNQGCQFLIEKRIQDSTSEYVFSDGFRSSRQIHISKEVLLKILRLLHCHPYTYSSESNVRTYLTNFYYIGQMFPHLKIFLLLIQFLATPCFKAEISLSCQDILQSAIPLHIYSTLMSVLLPHNIQSYF